MPGPDTAEIGTQNVSTNDATTLTADPATAATLAAIERFNDAFNRHDVDAVMAAMTDDCVFESTSPPDGPRFVGQAEVRAAWEGFFQSSPDAVFETEELFAVGDRCVVRWRYQWVDAQGQAGHIRGIDLFRVADGKVAEKLAYVKG
jgi:ketosteroid isomerase-like protein